MRIRVKICGVSTVGDAVSAAQAGADAIGLVFHQSSPRNVDAATARQIVEQLPVFVASVAVFRNADSATVEKVAEAVQPDYLQFHGDEDQGFCSQFDLPYIKAVPMGAGADVLAFAEAFADASALLLDSHGSQHQAGQGKSFDWQRVPLRCELPLILAGGLSPDNVAAAIEQVSPWAVDVSSGVESAPGRKSATRIQQFIDEVYGG